MARSVEHRGTIGRALAPWVLILSAPVLASCAYVNAVPVKPGSQTQGVRIYEQKPLLVVSAEDVKVVLVPNYNRAYALQFGSFLAKHDFAIEMPGGIVNKITSNSDSTGVAIAIVNLISKAVETGNPIGAAFSGAGNEGLGGRVQVYSVDFSDDGELIGLTPLLHGDPLLPLPQRRALGAGQTPAPAAPAGAGKIDPK